MLTSLVAGRYLSQQADHTYHLDIKLPELGTKAEANISLPDAVQSILARISNDTLDTTHLGILSGDYVLYLAKARGHRGIEMSSRPGARLRAQNTAMGKALLAAQRSLDEAAASFDPAAIASPRHGPSRTPTVSGPCWKGQRQTVTRLMTRRGNSASLVSPLPSRTCSARSQLRFPSQPPASI